MLTLSDKGARQGYAVHKTSGHSKSHQMTLLDSGLPLFVYFFFSSYTHLLAVTQKKKYVARGHVCFKWPQLVDNDFLLLREEKISPSLCSGSCCGGGNQTIERGRQL